MIFGIYTVIFYKNTLEPIIKIHYKKLNSLLSNKRFLILGILSFICNPLLAQWSTDPTQNTVINADPGSQRKPHIVSDGAGGAVVVWEEATSFDNVDIYAQRIDRRGNLI